MHKSMAIVVIAALLSLSVLTSSSLGEVLYADNSTGNLTNNTISNQFWGDVVHDLNLQGVAWNDAQNWIQRTTVIKYDELPSVVNADNLVSARLGIYLDGVSDPGYGNKTVEVKPAMEPWCGLWLTWENHPFGSDVHTWGTTPASDQVAISNTAENPAVLGWYWFDVTVDVVGWLDGSLTNNGLLIVCSMETDNWTNFFFSAAGEANAPQLELEIENPAICADAIARGYRIVADLNEDCYVEWADFGIFAAHWQMCNDPAQTSCDHPWE